MQVNKHTYIKYYLMFMGLWFRSKLDSFNLSLYFLFLHVLSRKLSSKFTSGGQSLKDCWIENYNETTINYNQTDLKIADSMRVVIYDWKGFNKTATDFFALRLCCDHDGPIIVHVSQFSLSSMAKGNSHKASKHNSIQFSLSTGLLCLAMNVLRSRQDKYKKCNCLNLS